MQGKPYKYALKFICSPWFWKNFLLFYINTKRPDYRKYNRKTEPTKIRTNKNKKTTTKKVKNCFAIREKNWIRNWTIHSIFDSSILDFDWLVVLLPGFSRTQKFLSLWVLALIFYLFVSPFSFVYFCVLLFCRRIPGRDREQNQTQNQKDDK